MTQLYQWHIPLVAAFLVFALLFVAAHSRRSRQ